MMLKCCGSLLSRVTPGGLNMRGAWAQSTDYALGDGILEGGHIYKVAAGRPGKSDVNARKPTFPTTPGQTVLDGIGLGLASSVDVENTGTTYRDFFCAGECVAAGHGVLFIPLGNKFYYTTDYGLTWTIRTVPSGLGLTDVFMFDATNFAVVGNGSNLASYYSSNAGVSWSARVLNIAGLSYAYSGQGVCVSFTEALITSGAYCYRTTDQGHTWVQRVALVAASHYPWHLVKTADRLLGVAVGTSELTQVLLSLDGATLYSTLEKGGSVEVNKRAGCSLNSLQKAFWMRNSSTSAHYTSDNGANWTNRTKPADFYRWWHAFSPLGAPGLVIVQGNGGTGNQQYSWARSLDYGANWEATQWLPATWPSSNGRQPADLSDGVFAFCNRLAASPQDGHILRCASLKWECVA